MNLGKTYHNFYTVCINAIKKDKNDIINKKYCIEKIEKLKDEKLNKKKTIKNRSSSYLYKPKIKNGVNKKELLTLDNIITIYNESEIKNKIKENKVNNIIKIEEKKIKIEKKPSKNKYDINKNQNIPKRYAKFKKILEYLESNNITLADYIEHNPFQIKPYQIPKSFEFLDAIKFQNYQFVKEALQYSNDYLFCFDYYGQTCYHWAAKLGYIRMLTILIDNGKYHNQKDYEGRTPLYLAAINNDKNICELLVRNKANAHLRDNNGNSPADVTTDKDLKFYLSDLLAQPYSNPSNKQKIANFLKERESLIQTKIKLKKFEEEQKRKKEIK